MLESIHNSSPERLMKRALLVLEGLSFMNDELTTTLILKNGGQEKLRKAYDSFCTDVYIISHIAVKPKCAHNHPDWFENIERLEKCLKELRIVDVEKCLNELEESGSVPT